MLIITSIFLMFLVKSWAFSGAAQWDWNWCA